MSKKEQILQMRAEGKSYKEIIAILGCSKSLICYYCGSNHKEKTAARQRKRREKNVLIKKVENFKSVKYK